MHLGTLFMSFADLQKTGISCEFTAHFLITIPVPVYLLFRNVPQVKQKNKIMINSWYILLIILWLVLNITVSSWYLSWMSRKPVQRIIFIKSFVATSLDSQSHRFTKTGKLILHFETSPSLLLKHVCTIADHLSGKLLFAKPMKFNNL